MSDRWTLHVGNCLDVMRNMEANSVDSIVTDPPYGLAFMGKKWDYDVPSVEIWAECLRVLKPGGHLLAFAGTRTQHRMAVRIEDGGFEIRDMIAWVYSTGFPKSLDVSKAIDKAAGVDGEYGEPKSVAHAGWIERGRMRGEDGHEGYQRPWMADVDSVDKNARQYIGGTESARQWQGWGTALKPALEPITLARKPLEGTVAANVQEWGTGAINVDGCRVGHNGESLNGGRISTKTEGWDRPWKHDAESIAAAHDRGLANVARAEALGRWPANLIHDGSDEVVGLFPQANGNSNKQLLSREGGTKNAFAGFPGGRSDKGMGRADSGSAARFFYCAKASKLDRDEGCDGLAVRKAGALNMRTDAHSAANGMTTADRANNHPTVKPTDLMRYLCRLITPPGGLVFDPFTGSGSTGKAAMLEGFRFIGAELSEEYAEIARARIGHAASRERQMELALS